MHFGFVLSCCSSKSIQNEIDHKARKEFNFKGIFFEKNYLCIGEAAFFTCYVSSILLIIHYVAVAMLNMARV